MKELSVAGCAAVLVGPRNGVGKKKANFDVVLVVQRIELTLEMTVFASYNWCAIPAVQQILNVFWRDGEELSSWMVLVLPKGSHSLCRNYDTVSLFREKKGNR